MTIDADTPATAVDPDTEANTSPDSAADTEADTDAPVLVDSPDAQRTRRLDVSGWRSAERRPILPRWARSRSEASDLARWAAGFVVHTLAYHAVRVPKYLARLVLYAPFGMARTVRGVTRWLFDLEGEPIRQDAARRADAEAYLKLIRERDRRVRWRGIVTAAGLAPAAGGVLALVVVPGWARCAAAALITGLLGYAGRPQDRPLLDTAVVVNRAAKLTSDVVVRGLAACGLAGITQALTKDPRAIGFVAPIQRDGPGWRADVELPAGVTAAEVMDRRDKLASGIGRPLGSVWPEGRPEVHPGRLTLWVGDEDMATAHQPAWPLLKTGTVDLFRPFPFGTDPRGRLIEITLMFASAIIGALPRMGKTFTVRLLLLAASLDWRTRLHIYELKGTGDLSPLEPVAHRYRCGDDEDDIAYALADMRELRDELRRRSKVIRELPRDLCPENKVTPELASKRSLGLHPILVTADECQRWFEHDTHGKELTAICEDLVRRGPAVGIIALFATQRPDAKSLPTGISANAVLRFCLKVMGQVENDMVLGTSAYKNGIRATMFSRRDLGIGLLAGEADDPRIAHSFYVDGPGADRVVARARAIRESAGTLTGHAIGDDTTDAVIDQTRDLLHDVLTICPPSEGTGKFWTETVRDRLAEHRPDTYADLTKDQLAALLRSLGVPFTQVWSRTPTGESANRRGIDTNRLAELLADRAKGGRATP